MPSYTARCTKCDKVFEYFSSISERNKPVECECGSMANRDVEAELAPRPGVKFVTENERWSISMGCPQSQIEEFRKRFPNSVYDNKGRLLVKNRRDKLRQMKERGMMEWGANETPWKN